MVADITQMGVESFAVRADVGDLDQVRILADEVGRRFPRVDILVNNAGIIDDTLLVRMGDEAWSSVIDTNLNGNLFLHPSLCSWNDATPLGTGDQHRLNRRDQG